MKNIHGIRGCLWTNICKIFVFCTPKIYMSIPELYQQMERLFGNINAKDSFYKKQRLFY